jgi:hypothetical protein
MLTKQFIHTPEAIEVSKGYPESYTTWDVDQVAIERGWGGVGILPVSINRDSNSLDLSNWDAIGVSIDVIGYEEDLGDQWDYLEFTHWAVGWVRLGIYNSGNRSVFDRVNELTAELADYPVLDENMYAVYEWNSNHPTGDTHCYSDTECECGRVKA